MKVLRGHHIKKIENLCHYCDSLVGILCEAGYKGKAEALENRYLDVVWSLGIDSLINDLNENTKQTDSEKSARTEALDELVAFSQENDMGY